MTPQEAIKKVHCCMHIGNEEITQARDMAISLFEKRISRPVILEGDGYDDKGELIYDTAICPNCGREFEVDYDEHFKNCPDCTQALDWSDTE